MKQVKEQFTASLRELGKLKTLVFAAMMIAVAVVLGYFTVQISDFIKIGFSFLANELTAFLFGPVVGSLVAGLADIIKYLIKPTGPFFPGFTISAIVGGLIYGVILYQKPLSMLRIVAAKVVVALVVNVGLNTYWLTLLYGSGFFSILPARLLKQVVMVPIEAMLFFIIVKVLREAKILAMVRGKSE